MIRTLDLTARANKFRDIPPASAPARILLTSDIGDFKNFWPRSDHIGAARCYAFQCADILELECATLAENTRPLFVAIVGRNDEPLLLLALKVDQHYFGRVVRHIKILKFLEKDLSDYNAPVVYPPVADWNLETVRAVWSGLRKILPPFDSALFVKMPDRVGDLPNPLSWLSGSQRHESGHALTLNGTWEEIAHKLPRRRHTRYQTNRLQKLGKLSFKGATLEDYDSFLNVLIRQKGQRYLRTRGYNAFDRVDLHAHLSAAKHLLYPSGPVCLHGLMVGDTVIALNWGYLVGSRYYGVIFSADLEEWNAYSPGYICMTNQLQWCFERGVKVFDFGIGNEAYKSEYCNTSISLHDAEIPSTIKGHLSVRWPGRRLLTKAWIARNLPVAQFVYRKAKALLSSNPTSVAS